MGNEESSFGDDKDIEEDVSNVQTSSIIEEIEEDDDGKSEIEEIFRFDMRYFSHKKYESKSYVLVKKSIPFCLNNEQLFFYKNKSGSYVESYDSRMIRRCPLTRRNYHRILCVLEKIPSLPTYQKSVIKVVGIAKKTSDYVDLLLEGYKQNFRFSLESGFSVPIRVKLDVVTSLASSLEFLLNHKIGLVNFGLSDIWFQYGFVPILDCASPSKIVVLGKGLKKNKGISLHPKFAKYEAPELRALVKKNRFTEIDMRLCMCYTFGILIVELFTFQFYPLRTRFTRSEKEFAIANSVEDLIRIQEKCCNKKPSERYTNLNDVVMELKALTKKLKGMYHYKRGGNDVLSKYFEVSDKPDLAEDIDEKERNMECRRLGERNFRIRGLETLEISKSFLLL